MSEFLTKNNFYQIRDVLPKVKVGIIDYNATRKINRPLQVQRNQKIDFKFDKNKIIDHKTQIIDLNYFPDILDFLGSDAYVVFPFYSFEYNRFEYKWALYYELYKKITYYNDELIHNREFINYKDKKTPIIYMKSYMHYIAVDDEGLICVYDNSPDIRYHKCYGCEYWIFDCKIKPYVWITNGRDLTYGFNSNFKK